ncbi:hypothetical protein V0242_24485 (plasmid) [Aeromonas hydrophila]|uniref:hypothetical protein n=1 Tax=Aeromonas hydrophila TaxID=644 RepID=UPI002ED2AC54|nr:hypothetical protein V0242_24485 [Aeromonas hydrophila]
MTSYDVINLLGRWFGSANIMGSIHLCIDDPGYGPRAFVWVPHARNKNGKPDCVDAIDREKADHLFRIVISELNYAGSEYIRGCINESIVIKEGVALSNAKIHGIYHPMSSSMARRLYLTKDLSGVERAEFNAAANDVDRSLDKILSGVEQGIDNK